MIDNNIPQLTKTALCADKNYDPDWWHPMEVPGTSNWSFTDEANYARTLCGLCPAKQECLDYALQFHGLSGIWGGLDRKERYIMQVANDITPTSWVNSYESAVRNVSHDMETDNG